MANDSDDELPPLEADTVASCPLSRRSLLALSFPRGAGRSKAARAAERARRRRRQAVPRRAEEWRLRRRRSDDRRRVAQEGGRALAGGRPHVPIDRKGRAPAQAAAATARHTHKEGTA